uniref:Uncharacterized protein n=1 Tax=Ciona intestinalis TaxID=7719 RepID=H2XSE9_CIOIN
MKLETQMCCKFHVLYKQEGPGLHRQLFILKHRGSMDSYTHIPIKQIWFLCLLINAVQKILGLACTPCHPRSVA